MDKGVLTIQHLKPRCSKERLDILLQCSKSRYTCMKRTASISHQVIVLFSAHHNSLLILINAQHYIITTADFRTEYKQGPISCRTVCISWPTSTASQKWGIKRTTIKVLLYYHKFCSPKALRGLTITAIDLLLTAMGGRNMQRDFPDPVAILTKTSLQCSNGSIASNCPGLKPANLKYFWRVFSRRILAGQCTPLQPEPSQMAFSCSIMLATHFKFKRKTPTNWAGMCMHVYQS